MKKTIKNLLIGTGFAALVAATNVEAKEADKNFVNNEKPNKKTEWELKEEENKEICSKLPNSRYNAPEKDVMMSHGSLADSVVELHGDCDAKVTTPVWYEQIQSFIESEIDAHVNIFSLSKKPNGEVYVQAFVGENREPTELHITFTNAKSCFKSCPAKTTAVLDSEQGCECVPVSNMTMNMLKRSEEYTK